MASTPVLTAERLRQILRYDAKTGKFHWNPRPGQNFHVSLLGKTPGTIQGDRWQIKIDGRFYPAHDLAWLWMTGELPTRQVGHRDQDTLNNRWSNLSLTPDATGELTAELARELLRYDSETGDFWWKVPGPKRRLDVPAGTIQTVGTRSPQTVRSIVINSKRYYAHRLAFLIMKGRWPIEIDHWPDPDPLNNRWSNLREANRSQQNMNRRSHRGDLKGVSYYKRTGKWRADIKKDGRQITLGYYPSKEEARAAYVKAAKELFGEFFHE